MAPARKKAKTAKRARKAKEMAGVLVDTKGSLEDVPHSQASSTITPRSFLDLPAEIRVIIYEKLFESVGITLTTVWRQGDSTYEVLTHFGQGIAMSCKTIRLETAPLLQAALRALKLTIRWPDSIKTVNDTTMMLPLSQAEDIETIEIPYPEGQGLYLGEFLSLKAVYYGVTIYHFEECYRPDDEDTAVENALLCAQIKRHGIDNLGRPPLMVEPIAEAWLLNTQRNVSNGWVIEFDVRSVVASKIRKAQFTKKLYSKPPLDEQAAGDKNIEKIIRKEWKYSREAWTVKIMDWEPTEW